MADDNIVSGEGGLRKLTDAEFLAEFGHTPTSASKFTDKLFNGRYENSSFISGSINSLTGLVDEANEVVKNSGDTVFSISGSM